MRTIGSKPASRTSLTRSWSGLRVRPSAKRRPIAATTNGMSRCTWALMPSSEVPHTVGVAPAPRLQRDPPRAGHLELVAVPGAHRRPVEAVEELGLEDQVPAVGEEVRSREVAAQRRG